MAVGGGCEEMVTRRLVERAGDESDTVGGGAGEPADRRSVAQLDLGRGVASGGSMSFRSGRGRVDMKDWGSGAS